MNDMGILFVDDGNIFRSVLAEEYLRKKMKEDDFFGVDDVDIFSRGINKARYYNFYFYKAPYNIVKEQLFLMGFADLHFFKLHKQMIVSEHDILSADIVVLMDSLTAAFIQKNFTQQLANKIIIFADVKDPEAKSDQEKFLSAITDIKALVDELAGKIKANLMVLEKPQSDG